ncbi:MAG: N-acetyltransferase family protein [Bacillota bacterium]
MSEGVKVRPASEADASFLWDMLHEAIYVEPGESRPPFGSLGSGPLAHYLMKWGRPGDRALIAEGDGGPVGAAWFRLFSANDKGYGYVADHIPELTIATVAGVRGMGIGTKLLTLLIAQACQDGYRGISLSVDPRNAALHLYERTGFKYIGTDEGGSWTLLKVLAFDANEAQN